MPYKLSFLTIQKPQSLFAKMVRRNLPSELNTKAETITSGADKGKVLSLLTDNFGIDTPFTRDVQRPAGIFLNGNGITFFIMNIPSADIIFMSRIFSTFDIRVVPHF